MIIDLLKSIENKIRDILENDFYDLTDIKVKTQKIKSLTKTDIFNLNSKNKNNILINNEVKGIETCVNNIKMFFDNDFLYTVGFIDKNSDLLEQINEIFLYKFLEDNEKITKYIYFDKTKNSYLDKISLNSIVISIDFNIVSENLDTNKIFKMYICIDVNEQNFNNEITNYINNFLDYDGINELIKNIENNKKEILENRICCNLTNFDIDKFVEERLNVELNDENTEESLNDKELKQFVNDIINIDNDENTGEKIKERKNIDDSSLSMEEIINLLDASDEFFEDKDKDKNLEEKVENYLQVLEDNDFNYDFNFNSLNQIKELNEKLSKNITIKYKYNDIVIGDNNLKEFIAFLNKSNISEEIYLDVIFCFNNEEIQVKNTKILLDKDKNFNLI